MSQSPLAPPSPQHAPAPAATAAPAPAVASTVPSDFGFPESRKRALDSSAAAPSASVKRSRWGAKVSNPIQPTPAPSLSHDSLTPAASVSVSYPVSVPVRPDQFELSQINSRISLLTEILATPDSAIITAFYHPSSSGDVRPRSRSPSPDPIYDPVTGQRTNTREQRLRQRAENERNDLILRALQLNPAFKPPPGWKRPNQLQFQKKIMIPVDQHPNYNFRGQIIGPRGSTQQKLERELQCKILIRGKGSVPEGKSGRSNGAAAMSAHEPLHVLIQADTQDKLDNAERVIGKLLVPLDDRVNEHKTQQLRELALYNGTLREEIICRKCGKSGHKMFECPNRESSWQAAQVQCNRCGAKNHVEADCRQFQTASQGQRGDGGTGGKMAARERDRELDQFIDQLRGEEFVQAKQTGALIRIEGQQSTANAAPIASNAPVATKQFIHPARQAANSLPMSRSNGERRPPSDGIRVHSFEGREAAREFRPFQRSNHRNAPEGGDHASGPRAYPQHSHAAPLPSGVPYFAPPGFAPPFHPPSVPPQSQRFDPYASSYPRFPSEPDLGAAAGGNSLHSNSLGHYPPSAPVHFDPSVPPPPLPLSVFPPRSDDSFSYSYPPRQ